MIDVTKNAKDAAYVLVGLGVIGYQRAEGQARDLSQRFSTQRAGLDQQLEQTRAKLTDLAKDIETRFEPVRENVEERLDVFQGRLPERAKELVTQARGAAREAQVNLRSRLNGASAAA
ncbi:MAG: hypothetical protein H0W70_15620 [Actinobacteria bacterium]|nr:hypothetical protein [Actinomycetota bacterium]